MRPSRLRPYIRVACLLAAGLGVLAGRAQAHALDGGAAWSDGYTLIVLDAGADLQAARRFVQGQGGSVALMLPPNYLTGWIPPQMDAELIGRAGIRSLHRVGSVGLPVTTDPAARAVQGFFVRAARGEFDLVEVPGAGGPAAAEPRDADGEPAIMRPDALERGDISELEIAANLARQGIAAKAGGGAALAANSDYMTGTVSTTLFFVESDGTGTDPDLYNWTPGAEQDVFADAAAGLSWWVAQAKKYSNCWVVFRLQAYFASQDPRCAQWREPTLHPSTDYGATVQEVLGNFGYTIGGPLARAAAYDAALRINNQTDWAYSVFVAANPTGPKEFTDGFAAWSYIGGPYVSILQRSFNWSFKQVFTHETAHMFRACDEYYTPGYGGCTGCTSCADTGVPNGNCEQCNPAPQSCTMRTNAFALCSYTAGQIGWWRTPCTDQAIPAPRLDTADPAELVQGAEADVDLHGDFFAAGGDANLGSDIEVVSVQALTPALLRIHVRVGIEARPGVRDVVVSGPDGQTDMLAAGFRVRGTPRHYVSSQGANLFPYDRPERAAVDLASALAVCSAGDTLLLAGGTYLPFALHKTLVLEGGWADDFGSRAPDVRPSVVEGTGSAPAVSIDGSASRPVLDGLVLRGGGGQSASTSELGTVLAGGGLLVIDAAPILRYCILENNAVGTVGTPGAGGGAFFWRAHPTLEHCTVRGNHASRGGGLYFLHSDATLEANTLDDNDAGGTGFGAGIAALGSRLVLFGDRLTGNHGSQDGGGMHLESCPSVRLTRVLCDANDATRDGGGVASHAGRLELVACRLTHNTAGEHGGGIRADGDSLQIESTLVGGNRAGQLGGGMYVDGCAATLLNVTLAANDGGPASGLFWTGSQAAGQMRSCILAGNVLGGVIVGAGIPPALDWNLFWQNGGFDRVGAATGPNDVLADPRFAAPVTLDDQLGLESPALDAGDPDPARRDPDGSCNDIGAHGGPSAWPAAPARPDGLVALDLAGPARLTWNPSRAANVTTYVVYRDVLANFRPTSGNRVATLPAPTTSWLDPVAPGGAWYRVVAVDADGHASGSSLAVQPSPPSDSALHPPAFALRRIAPNPANPGAWIEYDLPGPAGVRLTLYDSRGRQVRELAAGARGPGTERVYWDGRDDAGRAAASGVYWVRLVAGAEHRSAKLVVIR